MKKQIFITALGLLFSLSSLCQSLNKYLLNGVWTEKENGITEIKWTFHSNGSFNNVSFWNNPVQVGGAYRVGKFSLDEKANTLKLVFEKIFTSTNEIVETHTDQDIKYWQIKSMTDDEIVIRRPAIWESDKKSKSYDGSTIEIRLKKLNYQIQDSN